MKTLLLMLVIFACVCAGYEYYVHTQEAAVYADQRANLSASIAKLKVQNKALTDEQASLTQKLTDLQNQAADLNAQISAAHDAATNAPPATPASSTNAAPAPASPSAASPASASPGPSP